MSGYHKCGRWDEPIVREFESPLHRPSKYVHPRFRGLEDERKPQPPPPPPEPLRICWYCGIRTQKRDEKARDFHTRDHVIPRIKGGGPTVTACKWCNSNKGSLSVEEFRALFGMLKNLPIEEVLFHGERFK